MSDRVATLVASVTPSSRPDAGFSLQVPVRRNESLSNPAGVAAVLGIPDHEHLECTSSGAQVAADDFRYRAEPGPARSDAWSKECGVEPEAPPHCRTEGAEFAPAQESGRVPSGFAEVAMPSDAPGAPRVQARHDNSAITSRDPDHLRNDGGDVADELAHSDRDDDVERARREWEVRRVSHCQRSSRTSRGDPEHLEVQIHADYIARLSRKSGREPPRSAADIENTKAAEVPNCPPKRGEFDLKCERPPGALEPVVIAQSDVCHGT